ncbi:hypothetical protein VP496E541_P0139 [Vibrio phage 496E54-1]|nr:hypothetical protein VP495E541_P0138 [Vibrio phage 495E54-1]CAH9013922.1 hypothetical protein VP496E541_P0139 [Vibrio phage 496E54-1]
MSRRMKHCFTAIAAQLLKRNNGLSFTNYLTYNEKP